MILYGEDNANIQSILQNAISEHSTTTNKKTNKQTSTNSRGLIASCSALDPSWLMYIDI